MKIPFLKMHGAANDFVVIDHRRRFLPEPLGPLVARMCDRRRGVGADGLLILEPDPEVDYAMRYLNADGAPADYCGNGARCLARLALDLGLDSGTGQVRFRTPVGIQEARRSADGLGIDLHFGPVPSDGESCEVVVEGRRFSGRLIHAGVPHFVTAVDRLESVPVSIWGSALRHHPRFAPAGANVDFIGRTRDGLSMRTYERGVEAETLACGSGAIATALWAAAAGAPSPVRVVTAGGDPLVVSFARRGSGYDVTLAGPAEVSFVGEWTDQLAAPAAGTSGRNACFKD